ncbi:DJ-1/PfpI family protein [Pseudorhodoferax sp.]|uniref:DJ-1/PfpI family protein n=1 Tax=Pseudorhodoferax sp. TaxID=1993553 RepID=UPI002DD696B3|nr:DJ-1/PfpI family protein [Pseudorhodoferax sp.]
MTVAPTTIVFALFPRITQLDFTGPHEVLWRLPGARVHLASAAGGPVQADGGLVFDTEPLHAVAGCDVLLVPGGMGVVAAMEDAEFIAQLRRLGGGARHLASVCTGSLALAAAGLLKGRRAACHWAWRELLAEFDGVTPDAGRVVRDGPVFTGGGVTAGIDMALALLAELADATLAQAVQLGIEYAPAPPFDSGRPETAPASVRQAVQQRLEALRPDRRAAAQRCAAALRVA